ncbi:mitogen-activated protein kinase kinase kinase 1-like [Rhododendron vialii]|uniref:mitogen-activated protein kinase kinase kinase 1-like n=1 Tax=Rhododendron vialii TaxID=182163 RepID=UPI00265EDD0E|nr:mitogen-activated protein kinase kinase kinase 1-like [Rhododendron vialii]
MHRIPRFFSHSDKKKNHRNAAAAAPGPMDPSTPKRRGTPKLDRRLAKKNIDYEPSTSSSSDAASPPSSLRTRSLDISPLGNRTSFRIQGIDGEFDAICRSLGLSGPDDFSIPAAAWEARKSRSSLDLPPRSRLHQIESPTGVDDKVKDCSSGGDVCVLSDRLVDAVRVSNVCELSADRLIDTFRVGNASHKQSNTTPASPDFAITVETSRCVGGGSGGGGGIKGVRPPAVLAPPPSILRPVVDYTSSTWDILNSFAPPVGVVDRGLSSSRGFSDDDEEEVEVEEEEEEEEVVKAGEGLDGARVGETARLSASCSFTTTSNDDDCSSSTTEPTSNISPNERFRRIISHWEKGELLGRGSFGSVYEGIADGGFFIAVKEVSLLDQGAQARQSIFQLEQEIALLSQFQHENIVQYYGTDKDESNLYIFLELVTKGSLLNLYQKYNLQESTVSSYTRQILHGLKYLHERNVVHRDIKCANILVDTNGSVKLADFGLAKVTKLNDVKSCKGTPFWMAPEVVKRNNQGYGLAADIWSLGCTVLEMLTRQIPYSDLESMQALFRIGRGVPPLVPDSLSADARDFILQCLQVNPSARPTAPQLLDHPYVKRSLSFSSGSSSPYNFGRRI